MQWSFLTAKREQRMQSFHCITINVTIKKQPNKKYEEAVYIKI